MDTVRLRSFIVLLKENLHWRIFQETAIQLLPSRICSSPLLPFCQRTPSCLCSPLKWCDCSQVQWSVSAPPHLVWWNKWKYETFTLSKGTKSTLFSMSLVFYYILIFFNLISLLQLSYFLPADRWKTRRGWQQIYFCITYSCTRARSVCPSVPVDWNIISGSGKYLLWCRFIKGGHQHDGAALDALQELNERLHIYNMQMFQFSHGTARAARRGSIVEMHVGTYRRCTC